MLSATLGITLFPPYSKPKDQSVKMIRSFDSKFCCCLISNSRNPSLFVNGKVRSLVTEFQSLLEPIDRVRRLLYYADLLLPFDEMARVPENRIMGCTTQVWLDASMDEVGRMRFRADSDSEIAKGFCSCLIYVLDGAEPSEVLMVNAEDLADMNVGLPGTSRSRVNTWHNVLISMQKKTKVLVAEREGMLHLDSLPSLIVAADAINANGSYAEARVLLNF